MLTRWKSTPSAEASFAKISSSLLGLLRKGAFRSSRHTEDKRQKLTEGGFLGGKAAGKVNKVVI